MRQASVCGKYFIFLAALRNDKGKRWVTIPVANRSRHAKGVVRRVRRD